MLRKESFYRHLLHECQSDDLQRRLRALDGLGKDEFLDLVEGQFLLDRLNSSSDVQEQMAIERLMCQVKEPLPMDALMAILEDWETSTVFLRMQVAHVLAVKKAEEAL